MNNVKAVRKVLKEKHEQHSKKLEETSPASSEYPAVFTQTIYTRGQLDLFNQLYPETQPEETEPLTIK